MKTSQQWWNEVKSDSAKLTDWLHKQYRGEVTAGYRVRKFAEQYTDKDSREFKILNMIGQQEETHASWIKDIMDARGINVDASDIVNAEKRYWSATLPGIKDFVTGSAVAAHAEGMRLDRIRAISYDEDAPEDIRSVFKKILKDETWHESAFRSLSTPEALAETEGNHKLGLEALGLEA